MYVDFFRSTPLVVQILIIAFGVFGGEQMVAFLRNLETDFFWNLSKDAKEC